MQENHFKSNDKLNNFNNVNSDKNISSYVPYADYNPMDYFPINRQIYNLQSKIIYNNPLFPNSNNINASNNNNNNTNKPMKIETDSDIIQDLTGNYLEKNNIETLSEEKSNKKEIEINLGKIIVGTNCLKNFPTINLKNYNKYNLSVQETILNRGDFFTAIKDDIKEDMDNAEDKEDINDIEMKDELKEKTIIPDDYLIGINENITNALMKFMNRIEMKACIVNNNKFALKKIIEIIYDKCVNNILEIKRNVKNRVKKIKSINLSNQLNDLIKFHNELISHFLSSQNKENKNHSIDTKSQEIKIVNENPSYLTYAEFYLQNSGKTFKCEICGKMFVNYQTLGGHMSKIHPNCSEKYKKQTDVRKQREGQRKLLDSVKEKLFEKYNLNYKKLKDSDQKEKIKSFIKAHQKEYEILRRKIYKENALKKDE